MSNREFNEQVDVVFGAFEFRGATGPRPEVDTSVHTRYIYEQQEAA